MRITGWVVAIVVLASGASAAAANDREGKELYAAYCASCHGPRARGDGVDADLFSPPPPNLRAGVLRKHSDDIMRRGYASRAGADPAAVAEVVRHAVEASRPRTRYVVTPVAKAQVQLRRLGGDRLWDAVMRRTYRIG